MCCPFLWLEGLQIVLTTLFRGPVLADLRADVVKYGSPALALAVCSLAACLLVNWLSRVKPAAEVAKSCAVMSAKGVSDASIRGKLEFYIERLYFVRYYFFYIIFLGGGALSGWVGYKYSDTNFPFFVVVFWTYMMAVVSAVGHHLEIRIPVEAARKQPQPVPFGKAAKTSDQRLRELGMI